MKRFSLVIANVILFVVGGILLLVVWVCAAVYWVVSGDWRRTWKASSSHSG